jgi:hypothetical protein
MSATPYSLLVATLAASSTLLAIPFTEDFESFAAGNPPPPLSGWAANTSGAVPSVTAIVTDNPSFVIDGARSFLVTADTFAANTTDFELGSYYSGINGGAFTNVLPGQYQVSAKLRVLDPGVTANLALFYNAFDSSWTQTTSVSVFSGSVTSSDGVLTWTSPTFTVNPGNDNFYMGLQVQATSGLTDLSNVRFVVDSSTLTAIPEPSHVALVVAAAALGFAAWRRRSV